MWSGTFLTSMSEIICHTPAGSCLACGDGSRLHSSCLSRQPNRSGAMADSQQAAAKQHQKLQTRPWWQQSKCLLFSCNVQTSKRMCRHPSRHWHCLFSSATVSLVVFSLRAKGAEEDPDPRDSRQRPMSQTQLRWWLFEAFCLV